jgi:hypothetical protein
MDVASYKAVFAINICCLVFTNNNYLLSVKKEILRLNLVALHFSFKCAKTSKSPLNDVVVTAKQHSEFCLSQKLNEHVLRSPVTNLLAFH